ncbi:MAG: ABC transporter permease [Desulfobacterales bacterium]|nr:ABC transporter permease [Desulfobacterales bacterium]MDJ0914406.1 ABC transporter permease [Desulfobacterales bacterium]
MRIIFEKRKSMSRKAMFLVPAGSFLISLILTAILLAIFKANPWATYVAMFKGAFGSWPNFTETLVKAIPLMLTGLGVLIAFRLKFWNIGAEGQLTFGGIAAAWVALFWSPNLPQWTVLPVAILMGMLAGALWAGIPALLKVRLKVDEVLTTLMLNYVAILFAEHLYYGPWRDPKGFGFPGTPPFPEFAWLPRIAGRAHMGLIFAIVLAVVIWFILNRTRWGFELKVIGNNPTAAQTQGIRIARNIMIALLFAGALSGLAGVCEVTGISRRLQQGLSIGYGYTAIIVAWLAQLNPIAAIFVALLIAALLVGGDQVQMMMGLPAAMGLVLQGMLLFPMLAGALFTEYKLRLIRSPKITDAATKQEQVAT